MLNYEPDPMSIIFSTRNFVERKDLNDPQHRIKMSSNSNILSISIRPSHAPTTTNHPININAIANVNNNNNYNEKGNHFIFTYREIYCLESFNDSRWKFSFHFLSCTKLVVWCLNESTELCYTVHIKWIVYPFSFVFISISEYYFHTQIYGLICIYACVSKCTLYNTYWILSNMIV